MRWEKILYHSSYNDYLSELALLEKNRDFCHHNQEHFLDVARLTYLFALESGYLISNWIDTKKNEKEPFYTRDIIYAISFLHDIGKGKQYIDGTPHEIVSAEIAVGILKDCDYDEEEIVFITDAIRAHRKEVLQDEFYRMLYRADKMSRKCFQCNVADRCNWKQELKNMRIRI